MYAFSCYVVPRACGCVRTSVKEEVKLPRGTKEANWEKGTGRKEQRGQKWGERGREGSGEYNHR